MTREVIELKDWTFVIDADNADVTYNLEKLAQQAEMIRALKDETVKEQAARIEKLLGITPLPRAPEKSYRRIRL